MKNLPLIPAFVLVLRVSILPAGASGVDTDSLGAAVRSPLERAGDYDGLAAAWLEAVSRNPRDFRSELLLRRLGDIRPFLKDDLRLVPALEGILEGGGDAAPRGTIRQVLLDTLADLYQRCGREADRERIEKDRGFLSRWLIIGPFGKNQGSPLDREYAPEKELRLDAAYPDGWQTLSWRKLVRQDKRPRLDPLDHVYPSNGVVYLLAQVKSDAEREVSLHRGSTEDLRIWLNGVQIARDDFSSRKLENRRFTRTRLAAGWNRILVKTRTSFWLRLCDSEGDPLPEGAVALEEGLEIHPLGPCPDPRVPQPPSPPFRAPWAAWLEALKGSAPEAPAEGKEPGGPEEKEGGGAEKETSSAQPLPADAHAALALLEGVYGRDDLAVQNIEEALRLAPGDAFLLYHAGRVYESAKYLPPSVSKNRAKAAYEAALAADPGFVPAHERLASLLLRDEQYPQAIARAKEALGKAPGFLPALFLLKSIHERRGYVAEEIDAVREIEKASPTCTIPPAFWAAHYRERGNLAQASAGYRKAFDLDKRRISILSSLAGIEKERGRLKEAEEAILQALREEPEDSSYSAQLLDLLADSDRWDEALKVAEAGAERNPLDPERRQAIGDLLERAGRTEEATAAYEKALSLEPGDLGLKRYMEARKLGGKGAPGAPAAAPAAGTRSRPALRSDEFWTPYDEKLEDWLGKVPTEGPLVDKAASVVVLDISVLRIEADGSYCEYVHQAEKLLSEESKDEVAKANVRGEILMLRTLTAAGESLEPVAAEGMRSFVMPDVRVGACVEYAYRGDHDRAGGRFLDKTSFFFQDPQFKNAFILSRYVILLPKGLDPGFLENNLAGAEGAQAQFARVEKTVKDLPGGGKLVMYEARDVPRMEPAKYMPPREEYVPNVEIVEKRAWEDIAGDLRSRFAGKTIITHEIEKAAAEAARGAEGAAARARAIYKYVNDLVATEGRQVEALDVLLEKSGDRTALFKALLDASGIPAEWAFLRPPEAMLPRTDWSYPRPSMFLYPYVAVDLEGKGPAYVSLDSRHAPFARLPEYLEGGKAFRVSREGQEITQLPPGDPERSAMRLRGALKLGEGSDVDAEVELSSDSVFFSSQRDTLKNLPAFQRDMALRALASGFFPGAKVKSAQIQNLEDPEKSMLIALALTAPKMLRPSGDEMLLRAVLRPSQMVRRFVGRPTREHPFHLMAQVVDRDSVRVDLGSTFKLLRSPSDVVLASALGTYSLTFKAEGDALVVTRSLTLSPGRIAPQDFPAFVEFTRKVDAAEQESLVLKKG